VLLAHVNQGGLQTFTYRSSSGSHDSDHDARTSPFAYPCRTVVTIDQNSVRPTSLIRYLPLTYPLIPFRPDSFTAYVIMVQCSQVSTFIRFLLLWRRHSKQLAIGVLVVHMDFKCSHTLQVMLPYSRRWDISFRLFLSHNKHMINQNSILFPTSPLPLVRHDKFTCIKHQSGFISTKIFFNSEFYS
jgi:hypothetical protein